MKTKFLSLWVCLFCSASLFSQTSSDESYPKINSIEDVEQQIHRLRDHPEEKDVILSAVEDWLSLNPESVEILLEKGIILKADDPNAVAAQSAHLMTSDLSIEDIELLFTRLKDQPEDSEEIIGQINTWLRGDANRINLLKERSLVFKEGEAINNFPESTSFEADINKLKVELVSDTDSQSRVNQSEK